MKFWYFNSLATGKPRCHFKTAILNLVLSIGIFTSFKDKALRWMPRDLIDDKSTLVQVMAWCRQATSHYLSLCWPSSMSPYAVTRPPWVNEIAITYISSDHVFHNYGYVYNILMYNSKQRLCINAELRSFKYHFIQEYQISTMKLSGPFLYYKTYRTTTWALIQYKEVILPV